MLTSPRPHPIQLPLHLKMNSCRYQAGQHMTAQTHPDRQISPWSDQELNQSPFKSHNHKKLARLRSHSHNTSQTFPFSNHPRVKRSNAQGRTFTINSGVKEKIIQTKLISISLDKDTNEDFYGVRHTNMPDYWKQQPNRVKQLKKKIESKERNIRAQQMQAYNKTIQMFSTCLTEQFTNDLVGDTLLIHSMAPKRQPIMNQDKQKYHQVETMCHSFFPNLTSSGQSPHHKQYDAQPLSISPLKNWSVKGEVYKNRIKELMIRQRGIIEGQLFGESRRNEKREEWN